MTLKTWSHTHTGGSCVNKQFLLLDGVEKSISDELATMASVEQPRSYARHETRCATQIVGQLRVPDVDAIATRPTGKAIDRRDETNAALDETYAELLEWAGAVVSGLTLPIERRSSSSSSSTSSTPLATDDSFVSDWLVIITVARDCKSIADR
jgi:hypothetical protein